MNQQEVLRELKGRLFELTHVNDNAESLRQTLDKMVQSIISILESSSGFIALKAGELYGYKLIASVNKKGNQSNDKGEKEVLDLLNSLPLRTQQSYYVTDSYIVMALTIEHYHCLFGIERTDLVKGNSNSFLTELSKQCIAFLKKVYAHYQTSIDKARYKELYELTEAFNRSMNMDYILEKVISVLEGMYPTYQHKIYVAHDYRGRYIDKILPLSYDDQELMNIYVTGEVDVVSTDSTGCKVYAPLVGSQGTYGVLIMEKSTPSFFPHSEIPFIKQLISVTAGALEKVQLYVRSQKKLTDLKLINETSRHLNEKLNLHDGIHYVSNRIMTSFDAQEVGVIFFEDDYYAPLKGNTAFFDTPGARYYIEYAYKRITQENESLFINNIVGELNDELVTFQSLIAVPMVQDQQLKGMVMVLHKQPYFFSFDTFKLVQEIVHHSTLAFVNAMLRDELEKLVVTDHLSKLYSRKYLDQCIEESMRKDSGGSFILLDIDNFKRINDTYGHQVGDDIIIQISNLIKGNIRLNDVAARWGGEELAVYLPCTTLSIAKRIANRLVKRVEEETIPKTTISSGISFWSQEQQDSTEKLFKRADLALYEAKKRGKNQAVIQEYK